MRMSDFQAKVFSIQRTAKYYFLQDLEGLKNGGNFTANTKKKIYNKYFIF